MLDDQSFSTLSHNLFHTLAHILCGLAFKLCDQLYTALNWRYAGFQISLAKFERSVGQRLSVQVQEVEHFD